MYDDGDVELLNLRKEKWDVLEDEPGSDMVCIPIVVFKILYTVYNIKCLY